LKYSYSLLVASENVLYSQIPRIENAQKSYDAVLLKEMEEENILCHENIM